ncbi:MAG: Aminopeptidase, partial [Myxococcaceae bacterium]|nr:Aminopeptidase [Myxococcaceae bacterium]
PTLYRVKLDPAAEKGAGAVIEVRLVAKVPPAMGNSDSLSASKLTDAKGHDYGAFSAAPEIISLAGMLPGVAALNDQGEPSPGPTGIGDLGDFELANWLVNVTVPSAWVVVAPGQPLGDVPEPGGKTRYTWAIAAARDFVLFATRGYETSTAKVDDITVESRYLAADKEAGKRVLKYAVDSLAEYQKRLGPYPYTTFRVLQARLHGGAGGMEFPGLVSVSTALYRGAADPLAALGMPGLGDLPGLSALVGDLKPMLEGTLEFTVAHEVGHQWFAMMIGSDAINEPVADEPLTQHAALLYLEWKHGKAAADAMRKGQLTGAYHMLRMMGGMDAAADRPTGEFNDNNEYAALIYGKAPLYFDQARKLVGDEKYFKTLRAYADSYRWGIARPDTLTAMLGKAAPANAKGLEKLRRRWWDEAHGDEDLGKPDLGMMFGGTGNGTGNGTGLDANTMKLLEEAIRVLGGGEP